jgi:glycosyltransferase involved in cell wall biosynthesis
MGRAVWFCIDLLIAKLLCVKLVWTVHNKYHHEGYYNSIERYLNIAVANLVDNISVKCGSAKKIVIDIYRVKDPSKIVVIPDGNYIDAYPNSATASESRERLNIDGEQVYLFFGHIRPYKGVERHIDMFKKVEDNNISLWIVGKPNEDAIRRQIKKKAADDERIYTSLELIPEEKVQYYMNAADVLVLPYQDILNSGSVYLGMSFGLPLVVPRLGCIPEIVSSEFGFLYRPEDEDGLKTALEAVRTTDDLQEMGAQAYHVAETMTWNKVAEEYAHIYKKS